MKELKSKVYLNVAFFSNSMAKVRILSKKELNKISRVNIVQYVLEGVEEILRDILLNRLEENIGLAWETSERKIRIYNLIRLLQILVEEEKDNPFSAKMFIEENKLLDFLKSLYQTFDSKTGEYRNWLIGRYKEASHTDINPHEINIQLGKIIKHLILVRTEFLKKINLTKGNEHLDELYNPEFQTTRFKIHTNIPNDYRSNFFFEAYVAELCPFTTLIQTHVFNDIQANIQKNRTLQEITHVNYEIDYSSQHSISSADNIRGFRIHGKYDDKKYPGSFIIIVGGNHRLRELYRRYINNEIAGDYLVVIQIENKISKEHQNFIAKEIKKREELRMRISKHLNR